MTWYVLRRSARVLWHRLGIFLFGNLLWLLVSLPIITIPIATGALYYLVHRVILEEMALDPKPAAFADFREGLRRYAWPATRLGFVSAVIWILLFFVLRFYLYHPITAFTWLAGPVVLLLIFWLCMQMYTFPLLIVREDSSTVAILREAARYTIIYPTFTAALILAILAIIAICTALAGPVLVLLTVTIAVVQSMALRFVRIELGEIAPSPVVNG